MDTSASNFSTTEEQQSKSYSQINSSDLSLTANDDVGEQGNNSFVSNLPSYYESTPLVDAPIRQPVDKAERDEYTISDNDNEIVGLNDVASHQEGTLANGHSTSIQLTQEQNEPNPHSSESEQEINPNHATTMPYPPLGTTETSQLFPEEFSRLESQAEVPLDNGLVGESATINETSVIGGGSVTHADGQVINHRLLKLPSYAGGGEYPAEPPPSYEDSNPIPVPQTMSPREPSASTFTPPTAQLISRNFGTTPIYTICPSCGEEVRTVTVFVPGALTYLMVCIFLMLGWWFMCCLIPFCVQGFKDVHHVCPHCKKTIGRYDRIGN
ncbi:uncharacterized protein LOC121430453 isoform X3 [Lytechinus variegatus]|nr:uncharacterized protein LOC121430453 isoform X3 [Lytechinus variegatus]